MELGVEPVSAKARKDPLSEPLQNKQVSSNPQLSLGPTRTRGSKTIIFKDKDNTFLLERTVLASTSGLRHPCDALMRIFHPGPVYGKGIIIPVKPIYRSESSNKESSHILTLGKLMESL